MGLHIHKIIRIIAKIPEKRVILTLIFVLALGVRVVNFARQTVFWQDQGRDAYLMHQYFEEGKQFIAYGPKASVGNFYLPPLYYQLHYLVSSLASFHPLAMYWVTIFAESLTPVFLFLVLERFSGRKTALGASLIYSLSYLPVLYGSSAWNPNMIPLFTTMSLYFFVLHLQDKLGWAVIPGILCLGIAASFHFQAVVLFPFVGLVWILSFRQSVSNMRYWLLGGCIFVLTLLPYLNAEIASNWVNGRAIVNYFREVHSQYFDRVSKPQFVLSFIPAFLERILIGTNLKGILLGRVVWFVGLFTLLMSSRKNKKLWLLVAYFLLILVMLRIYKGDKEDYYMSTLFILPAYLLAMIVTVGRRLSVIFLCSFAIASSWFIFSSPVSRGYQAFTSASEFIQSQLPNRDAVVFFHDPQYINLFAYAFTYQNPIKINPTSEYVVDICSPNKPCDYRYKDICWSNLSTRISLIKHKYGYEELRALIYPGKYEIVIGKIIAQPDGIRYLDNVFQSQSGSDILLRDFVNK